MLSKAGHRVSLNKKISQMYYFQSRKLKLKSWCKKRKFWKVLDILLKVKPFFKFWNELDISAWDNNGNLNFLRLIFELLKISSNWHIPQLESPPTQWTNWQIFQFFVWLGIWVSQLPVNQGRWTISIKFWVISKFKNNFFRLVLDKESKLFSLLSNFP